MRTLAFVVTLTLMPSLLPAFQTAGLDDLYQSNRWFEFRDAMLAGNPSAFYRGKLALAFHDWAQAEKEFSSTVKSSTDPVQRFEATLGLQSIYSLTGRRKDGRALLARMDQITRGSTITPQTRSLFEQYRSQLEALSGYPDQATASRGASRIYYAEVDNRLVVPVMVNGTAANYMIDTGAASCVVSQAEAKRLGLVVHPTAVPLDTITEHPRKSAGVAIASDLIIGNFHLRNVMFLVTGDDDDGGIIGLPVVLALETLRWSSDGTMEFGFPAQPRNLREANLCLVGTQLVTRTAIAGRPLDLVLDTGSYGTKLFSQFARIFADLVKDPVKVGPRDIGNDLTDPQVTTLAELTLRVGGIETRLKPALVLSRDVLDDTLNTGGLLGIDLLGQSRSVTLDLTAMKLTMEGADRAGDACDLPPDFLCASGFSCRVKRDEEGCFLDRVPVNAWPGNPVVSERSDDSNCVLGAGASCSSGGLCRVVFDSNQSCHIEHVRPTPAVTSAITPIASPTTPPPSAANAREILQRFLKYDSLDDSAPKDYVYLQDEETKVLNKDGSVKETKNETREIMNLFDANYSRLIKKNGEALPPDKARAEQARFDKAVDQRAHETAEAKAKRQESERKQAAEALTCEKEFLDIYDSRVTGTEDVNGRATWIVELDPKPNPAPKCGYLKTMSRFRAKLWIDQQEYRAPKWEADNIAPVTWGAVLMRFPAGGLHVSFEQQRHEDGVWLPLQEKYKVNLKALLFVNVRVDVRTNYYDYRKFQSDSRILPVGN